MQNIQQLVADQYQVFDLQTGTHNASAAAGRVAGFAAYEQGKEAGIPAVNTVPNVDMR